LNRGLHILSRIRRWPRPFVALTCSLLVLGIGVVDYVTGTQVSVTVVYLLPIALATWRISRQAGMLLAGASAVTWLVVEHLGAGPYGHPLIQFWNAAALLTSFVIIVLLLSVLNRSYETLEERVRQRTRELTSEIAVRRQAEENLARTNLELCESQENLMRSLSALRTSHAELEATQLQLIQAAKMESVGRLAAGVAHEVKNPLTTIQMGIDYLEQLPALRDPTSVTVIRDQREAVQRATAVISELLDFSAPAELRTHPEDLNAIILRALGWVKHELVKGRILTSQDLDSSLPLIALDRNKIEQAFLNLFTNAIHAMPQGGTLTMRTYAQACTAAQVSAAATAVQARGHNGITVTAEIDDTGTGIPEAHLARIFDPFFTTKAPGKGSGLGLSIVRQIVQMHGGTIEISNRSAGGARVTITFYQKGTEQA
jgi:signal transduction histidine kinase